MWFTEAAEIAGIIGARKEGNASCLQGPNWRYGPPFLKNDDPPFVKGDMGDFYLGIENPPKSPLEKGNLNSASAITRRGHVSLRGREAVAISEAWGDCFSLLAMTVFGRP